MPTYYLGKLAKQTCKKLERFGVAETIVLAQLQRVRDETLDEAAQILLQNLPTDDGRRIAALIQSERRGSFK